MKYNQICSALKNEEMIAVREYENSKIPEPCI